jgi:hypothetical protein
LLARRLIDLYLRDCAKKGKKLRTMRSEAKGKSSVEPAHSKLGYGVTQQTVHQFLKQKLFLQFQFREFDTHALAGSHVSYDGLWLHVSAGHFKARRSFVPLERLDARAWHANPY